MSPCFRNIFLRAALHDEDIRVFETGMSSVPEYLYLVFSNYLNFKFVTCYTYTGRHAMSASGVFSVAPQGVVSISV